MSIIETKFRKGYVETPILNTENILVGGEELKMFDTIDLSPSIVFQQEEPVEIGASDNQGNYSMIVLINKEETSPIPLKAFLTKLTINVAAPNSEAVRGFVVLFVYGKKQDTYTFLGASSNYDFNNESKSQIVFNFDNLPLFNTVFNDVNVSLEAAKYDEIAFRLFGVTLDEETLEINQWTEEETLWENYNTSEEEKYKKQIRCKVTNSSEKYNRHVVISDNRNYSPHVIFEYKIAKTVFGGDKVFHVDNDSRHLNPNEKEYMLRMFSTFEDNIVLFKGEDYDVNKIIGGTSYSNEQIYGFYFDCSEFKNAPLTSVSIRRNANDGDFGNAGAARNDVFLTGEALDENKNVLETFSSENNNRQIQSDNGVTTWDFKDVIIKENWKSIRFRVSTEKGVIQDSVTDRKTIRTRYVNNKTYLNNQKTIEADGIERDYTTDFCITYGSFKQKLNVLENQLNELKEDFENNSASNELFEQVNSSLTSHIGDASHLTSAQKTSISKVSTIETNLNTHKNDNTVHMSQTEKTNLQSVMTGLNELRNNFTKVKRYEVISTLNDLASMTPDQAPTTGVQLSRQHSTTGVIRQINFYYKGGTGATGYLAIQIFDNNEVQIGETIYSNNVCTQQGENFSMFTFDNLVLPDDFRYLRMAMVSDKSLIPDIPNQTNCLTIRCRPIKKGNFTWDDDDCCTYGTDNNWVCWIDFVKDCSSLIESDTIISKKWLVETPTTENLENFLSNSDVPYTFSIKSSIKNDVTGSSFGNLSINSSSNINYYEIELAFEEPITANFLRINGLPQNSKVIPLL